MDSPPKVKHEKMDKPGSKPMNKFPSLKFCERSRAPVIWCVCVCMCVCMCLCARVCRSGGAEEMTCAWLGRIIQGPSLRSAL